VTGEISSRVALVSKSVTYLSEIEHHDVQAFAIRARPPVLTRSSTDTTFDSRDVLGATDMVRGLRATDEQDNMGLRNQINVAQFKQQQDLIRTLNEKRIDSSQEFWAQHVDPSKNTYLSETLRKQSEGYVPRFIPLPNDAVVASFDLPQERHDLVSLQKNIKRQVCIGMGVPEGYIDGTVTGGHSGSAMKMMDEFVRTTLTPLRDCLRRLMIEVYEKCFPGQNGSSVVQCVFSGAQNVTNLLEYYREGIVTFDAVTKAIANSENLNANDFSVEDPTIKHLFKKRKYSEND
jgi:hypothetical protein